MLFCFQEEYYEEELEPLPADPVIVEQRIRLVEEAVRKQWLIAEALHDFDKESIPNWPDYSTLQSLVQGNEESDTRTPLSVRRTLIHQNLPYPC